MGWAVNVIPLIVKVSVKLFISVSLEAKREFDGGWRHVGD
jgi:hypothetical protein